MRYRRAWIPGATYFFTVNLADRRSHLLVDHIDALRAAVRDVKRRHPFEILAWVVLPEHMHTVWTLPPDDSDYSTRWNQIKGGFSRRIPPGEFRSPSRTSKRERGIWQRRFWEHLIRDDADYRAHVAYCWGNPVKHGYVARAVDWPFSSIHRDIRAGRVEAEWSGSMPEGDFGD